MKFSIVTPSFRNSSWLKLCIASVADQPGVDFSLAPDFSPVMMPGNHRGTFQRLSHARKTRCNGFNSCDAWIHPAEAGC